MFHNAQRQVSGARIREAYVSLALFLSLFVVPGSFATAQIPSRPDRGINPIGSYAISDIESVNLTNGNMSLAIPLASLPPIAGGKLSGTIKAYYNSKLWNVYSREVASESGNYVEKVLEAEQGWRIGTGYVLWVKHRDSDYEAITPQSCNPSDVACSELKDYVWKMMLTTPDGATHELRPLDYFGGGSVHDFARGYYKDTPRTDSVNAPMRYYSFDGSRLWATIEPFVFNPTSWSVYLPDGTVIETSNGIQRIKDINGNKIKIWTDIAGSLTTTHCQDELTGREIKYISNSSTSTAQAQYQTVDGNWVTIDVNWGITTVFGQTYEPGSPCELGRVVNMPFGVIRSIVLPQTEAGLPRRQFTFSYNSDNTDSVNFQYKVVCFPPAFITVTSASHGWGSLSQMVTPAGATVDYSYSLDGFHQLLSFPEMSAAECLTSKSVTHDGTTDTWEYGASTDGGGVANPDGSFTSETIYPRDPALSFIFGGSDGRGGLVYRTNQSGKVIVERHWTQLTFAGGFFGVPGGLSPTNPVVDAEYTTLLENGQPVKMSAKKYQYDFNGNILQETQYDWFDPATVSRDAQGVPIDVPAGAVVLKVINNSYHNQATTSNSPNVYAKRALATAMPRILNAPRDTTVGASQTRLSYDGQAFGAAPTLGNLTRVSKWDDQAGAWRDTTYGYDSFGNKITITDSNNHVTNIVYDPATHAQPTQVTVDPLNGTGAQTTTTVYDYWTGLVTSVTDPNNQTTTTDYANHRLGAVDPFGRPGMVTGPPVNSVVDGVTYSNQQRKVKTTYFDEARQVTVESDLNQTGDSKLKSRASYDQLGRAIKTESSEDGTANYSISTETVYVQMGLITLTSNPKRSAAATTDGWTRATRDTLGRVIEVATFSGATQPPNTGTNSNWTGSVTTIFNANQVTVTDQAGKKRRSKTDALDRLVQVVEDPDGVAYLTDYSYDTLGNLTVVNQGGQHRYFFYDSLGRLIRAKNPEQSANSLLNLTNPPAYNNNWSMAYSYDANGNLASKTDARNITTTYGYDALNRNTTVSYSDSTPSITLTYDTATLGKGRLQKTETAGSMGSRVTINAYDALGRPLSKSQQFFYLGAWGTSYTTQQTYDLAGNVKRLTYHSGRFVDYTYDQAGRLESFIGNLGGSQRTYADEIKYNAAGQMIKEHFVTDTPLYHKRRYNNRLQFVDLRLSTGSDELSWDRGAIVFFYGMNGFPTANPFVNDPTNNGNLVAQIHYVPISGGGSVQPQVDTYVYDALNRIAGVNEGQYDANNTPIPNVFKQDYGYDRYGNRKITSATGGVNDYNPVYDQATNRIDGLGYDAAGNIILDPNSGGTMTYDAENRLLTATSGGGGNYIYNADGKRVRRITSGQETWYVYGCGGELLAEYAANAAPTAPQKEYGYRSGQLLIIAESGSGGGVSFVKPALRSSDNLIGKAGLEADSDANGPLVVDEPVAAQDINEGHGSITADYSDGDNTMTLMRGGPRTTAEEYGNAPPANDIGGELLAEHPADASPNAPQKEYSRGARLPVAAQSVVTLNPTAYQTPDGFWYSAVSDPSNTGHGDTTVSAVGDNWQEKDCRWHTFQAFSGTALSVTLKVDWSESGSVSGSFGENQFKLEYSLNGGSNWSVAFDHTQVTSSNYGTFQISLSPSQNISQVQVRDYLLADGHFSGSSASLTASISNIRLEVETDTTVPVISNVAAGSITGSSATITWTTNENSDSQVEYRTNTGSWQSTTLNPALVTAHSQGLSSLAAGTEYHYRVKSRDAAGNLAVSSDFSFTTLSVNDAAFVSQSVPATMTAGEAYPVTVTMLNQGTTTWTPGQLYRLGSQNPQDNGTWGLGRVDLAPGETIPPGGSKTFTFTVTAPSNLGSYNFQWRMVRDGVEWFGAMTPNIAVQMVLPDTTPPTVTSFSPSAGATNVNANSNVTVTFSEAMNAGTVNGSTVELRDPSNTLVSATVSYNAGSLTATLDPTASLAVGVTYTARVRGGGTDPRVKDVAGNALAADVTWTFTTAQNGSGGIKWLVTDHLGSTRMVIDETGGLPGIKRHDFAPFGEELYAGIRRNGAGQGQYGYEPPHSNVRQRYTSKERDSETGLDYFGARYFASMQGRFTSVDPIFFQKEMLVDPQRFNLYAYTRNNPLRFVDPNGEAIELPADEEKRGIILAALREIVGEKAGAYIYENKRTENGKTRYFVGINDGPSGKRSDFFGINKVSSQIGRIIDDTRIASVDLVEPGTRYTARSPDGSRTATAIIGPIGRGTPGATDLVNGNITMLNPKYNYGSLPGSIMSNGVDNNPSFAITLAHEFGHVQYAWGHAIGLSSNDTAVFFENQVRLLKDPSGPTRKTHNPGDSKKREFRIVCRDCAIR